LKQKKPKTEVITLRIPEIIMEKIRSNAEEKGRYYTVEINEMLRKIIINQTKSNSQTDYEQ